MIISASRRTDIPNYYSEWFFNRIKEGFLYVQNPMNPRQISKIGLSPEVVDCIVFWTKNPEPMLERLDELWEYKYYFQFTLTGYGKDIECNIPHKRDKMLDIFRKLSEKAGNKNVIWRYDPILFAGAYTEEYHLRAFEQIAEALSGYTRKCVISFADIYIKNKKQMEKLRAYELSEPELIEFSERIAGIAKAKGITVSSCAETIDLSGCGIEHNCCIDRKLIEEIVGCPIKVQKDKNQRAVCGCVESVEIGAYNTCPNGCKYCYANSSLETAAKNFKSHDPHSPLLCGQVRPGDKVTERKMESVKDIREKN